ncbi:MAG: hypothetical protein AAFR04_16090 [Pseudomonadota bacterium]
MHDRVVVIERPVLTWLLGGLAAVICLGLFVASLVSPQVAASPSSIKLAFWALLPAGLIAIGFILCANTRTFAFDRRARKLELTTASPLFQTVEVFPYGMIAGIRLDAMAHDPDFPQTSYIPQLDVRGREPIRLSSYGMLSDRAERLLNALDHALA